MSTESVQWELLLFLLHGLGTEGQKHNADKAQLAAGFVHHNLPDLFRGYGIDFLGHFGAALFQIHQACQLCAADGLAAVEIHAGSAAINNVTQEGLPGLLIGRLQLGNPGMQRTDGHRLIQKVPGEHIRDIPGMNLPMGDIPGDAAVDHQLPIQQNRFL